MYNYLRLVFITSCIILSIQSAPTISEKTQKSIHDKLLELSNSKCPYLKTTKLLDPNSKLLDTCPDYDTVSNIIVLNRTTVYNIPCLLYYNSFVSLCNTVTNIDVTKIINNNTVDNALKNYNNISNICADFNALQVVPEFKKSTKLLTNIATNNLVCERVCVEVNDDTVSVTPICSLTAFQVNITSRIQKSLEILKETKENKKPVVVKSNVTQNISKPPLTRSQPINDKDVLPKEALMEAPQPEKAQIKTEPEMHNADTPPQQTQEKIEQTDLNTKKSGSMTTVDNTNAKDMSQTEVEKNDEPSNNESEGVGPMPNLSENKPVSKEEEHINANQVDSNKNIEVADTKDKQPKENIPQPDQNIPNNIQDSNNPETPEENAEAREETLDEAQNEDMTGDDDTMQQFEPSDPIKKVTDKVKNTKPQQTDEDPLPAYNSTNTDEEDSFFFIYFMMVCAVFILGYIGYHNKQKVLALVIEGRRGRRGSRRGRPNSANYHKLDSNLEEAVTSSCNKNTTNVIY